ncbi:WD40 repeat-like protein [Aulographum hederae CBS 113979]|uniref:WD40 repeat-like protein n=1 Tax=Aulographum hederae CBS 113979 TaxID=1176131 RepID=A0A6G1GKX2_9PEZI|nr:WD40 repeat-like protein [Aulographum hederae CBS 113979]
MYTPLDEEKMEQKMINEEYKIWKKNCPLIYDMIYARGETWPLLTAEFFPTVKHLPAENLVQHRMLLGTFTDGIQSNYLQVATMDVPATKTPDPSKYDEETGEIGGHGAAPKPLKWTSIQKINHPSEVNKARYQPQNPDILAAWATDGTVRIYDRTKHPMVPKGTDCPCEIELIGHESEGFGLAWSPFHEGQLLTGSEDKTVRTWDIKQGFSRNSKTLKPLNTYKHHTATVNDVDYHPIHSQWFATVSDDLTLQIIDTRRPPNTPALMKVQAHTDAINCVSFHPKWDMLVATGSADTTIALWDLRCLDEKSHSFEKHKSAVVKVEWCPQEPAVFASASYDRRILFWDLSKIGDEQTAEEAEEGPPELMFMHGGFTNRVCDFSWNRNEPWTMLATAEDNQLQIFRPAENIWKAPLQEVPNHEVDQ